LEVYVDVDFDFDGFAVLHRGLEFVLTDSVDGFFTEAHADVANYADVGWGAVFVDDQADFDVARELGLAGFFGELGVDLDDKFGCADSAADVVDAATDVSTGAGTDSVAVAGAEASTAAIAHREALEVGGGVAHVRHRVISHFEVWLDDDRGCYGQLGRNGWRGLGRDDLLLDELGQMPLGYGGVVMRAAAASDCFFFGCNLGWRDDVSENHDVFGRRGQLDVLVDEECDEEDEQGVEGNRHGDRLLGHLGRHQVGDGDWLGFQDQRRELFGEKHVAEAGDHGGEDAFLLDFATEVQGLICGLQGWGGTFLVRRESIDIGHKTNEERFQDCKEDRGMLADNRNRKSAPGYILQTFTVPPLL